MKIVFLHRANDPYTLERIKYFSEQNHEVYSISFSVDSPQNDISQAKVIKLKKYFIDRLTFVHRFSHFFELKRLLKNIAPDILHIVSALNLFYANTKYAKVKIIENQGSDVLYAPLKHKFLKKYYNYYYKKVDGIIQDSKISQEMGIKYGASDNVDLNKIIEIGIDFKIFNKNVEKGFIKEKYKLNDRQIIFHSRGTKDLYNLETILMSIKLVKRKFPHCIFVFTTTLEQLKPELRSLIEKQKLKNNLLFVGFQNRITDLKYFYRDADVNISIPSSDSSPFSVYESMACLTPNIVSDLPWLKEKFIPNKHLLVCEIHNEEDVANSIIKVLTGNHELDLHDTYKVVENKINFHTENKKLEALFENLLLNKIY